HQKLDKQVTSYAKEKGITLEQVGMGMTPSPGGKYDEGGPSQGGSSMKQPGASGAQGQGSESGQMGSTAGEGSAGQDQGANMGAKGRQGGMAQGEAEGGEAEGGEVQGGQAQGSQGSQGGMAQGGSEPQGGAAAGGKTAEEHQKMYEARAKIDQLRSLQG